MEAKEVNDDDLIAPPEPHRRRSICGGCDRPQPVCLCHVIPNPPILTSTKIIVIQHPHESLHKLNTTHLLIKSLLNATSVTGRRLTPHLLAAATSSLSSSTSSSFYYLFPPSNSSAAVTLSNLSETLETPLSVTNPDFSPAVTLSNPDKTTVTEKMNSTNPDSLVLIVFDATWKHAKEMVAASEGYLSQFATRVCLDGFDEGIVGGNIFDSELLLRKEPCGGCVSTLEAVARWLGVVEENGKEIEEKLVRVLREMVRLQSQFLKSVKARPKLVKKSKGIHSVASN